MTVKLLTILLLGSSVLAEKSEQRANTLDVIAFGDATHERELIFVYTAKNGLTLLQQNRQNSDGAQAVGSVAGGWKFRLGKNFSQTTIVGPVFGYKPKAGYDGRIIVYFISSWNTKYFRFNNTAKLSAPTNQAVAFGGRYMQTIKGPTQKVPRFLRGLALATESLHTSSGGGRWLEFRVGPAINLGEVLGKKGFWSRLTIFPYRDFCRPQPGKPQIWDVRIQYIQTFHLRKRPWLKRTSQ